MKLEVGMYVRTKDGIIDKVIIDYKGKCNNPNCNKKHISCKYMYYEEKDILKASHNIIDLIEVGDYVNGYMISGVYDDDSIVNEYNLKHKKCLGKNIYDEDYQEYLFYEEDIKSIVTKEMMESVTYYVE